VNGLASGLYEQGRYAEAEELYRQTLEIRRRVSGEEHPVTLRSMYNLAISLDALGRYADAEALYRQTLGVHRRVLGEEHPETPDSMRGLADVLSAQGKTEEARPLTEQLIALRRKRAEGAEATPADLDAYAGLLLACEPEDQRDPSAALPFAEKAVEQTGGKNLDFLGTLALACHNTGNTDRAVEMQRKALDLLPSDQTPKRVALEGRLGQYLTAQGEAIRRALPKDAPRTEQARECFAEAETLLLGAHQALTAREYVPPKELKESLDRLMKLYDSWDTAEPGKGYAAKAEEYRALLEAKPEDAAEK
jgi:tetratricopeptide (TPR) repeat protein